MADIVTSEAYTAKNKQWNDMTSPSVDYGYSYNFQLEHPGSFARVYDQNTHTQ